MNGDGGDEMQYIIGDDGDKRGDISVDDGRHGFRSQETSQYLSHNCGEIVDGDWRGGCRSHTIHYSSHNPEYHNRLLCLSIPYLCVHESLHDNERTDVSGDGARFLLRSQYTIHY